MNTVSSSSVRYLDTVLGPLKIRDAKNYPVSCHCFGVSGRVHSKETCVYRLFAISLDENVYLNAEPRPVFAAGTVECASYDRGLRDGRAKLALASTSTAYLYGRGVALEELARTLRPPVAA